LQKTSADLIKYRRGHRLPARRHAMMPIYGKLGDRFGRKPIMLAAIGLFVAAQLCASSPRR
jgi:MFS family permease